MAHQGCSMKSRTAALIEIWEWLFFVVMVTWNWQRRPPSWYMLGSPKRRNPLAPCMSSPGLSEPQSGWSPTTTTKCVLSEFWRLQVLNQAVGRATLSLKVLGMGGGKVEEDRFFLPLSASGGPGHPLASGSINPTFPPSSLLESMSSQVRAPYWAKGPVYSSTTTSKLTSAMTLFPSKVTFWGMKGLEPRHFIWGDTIQPTTAPNVNGIPLEEKGIRGMEGQINR